jgi:peptidoglycan/xylan/chitin deacetylase (PgdA/CDA1 family)
MFLKFMLKVLRLYLNIFPANKIICLHSISGNGYSEHMFKELLFSLKSIGYEFTPLSKVAEGRKNIAISFDDGYEDNYTTAYPILNEFDAVGTVFIVTDFIQGNIQRKDLVNNGLQELSSLSKKQISILIQSGWDVGYHTKSHTNLYQADNSQLDDDFKKGLNCFSDITGNKSSYCFAYPFGFIPKDKNSFEGLLVQTGCLAAYTTRWGEVNMGNRYYIKRVVIGDNDKLIWTLLKISGILNIYAKLKWRGKQYG